MRTARKILEPHYQRFIYEWLMTNGVSGYDAYTMACDPTDEISPANLAKIEAEFREWLVSEDGHNTVNIYMERAPVLRSSNISNVNICKVMD